MSLCGLKNLTAVEVEDVLWLSWCCDNFTELHTLSLAYKTAAYSFAKKGNTIHKIDTINQNVDMTNVTMDELQFVQNLIESGR